MLDNALIKKLKQTNISVDADKTKERVAALWKSANNAKKKEATSLADIVPTTVYRAYNTGSVSAKLAVALCQTLNANPFYLTGEQDENSDFYDELLKEFLLKHGYEKLVVAMETGALAEKKTRQRRSAKAMEEVDDMPQETDDDDAECEDCEQDEEEVPAVDLNELAVYVDLKTEQAPVESCDGAELSDEEILTLIHAIKLKAERGAGASADALSKLYGILLG